MKASRNLDLCDVFIKVEEEFSDIKTEDEANEIESEDSVDVVKSSDPLDGINKDSEESFYDLKRKCKKQKRENLLRDTKDSIKENNFPVENVPMSSSGQNSSLKSVWKSKSIMSADRDFWEEFLNTYKLYPCLWDSKSDDYSNKQLRVAATTELVDKCKVRYPKADPDFVKKKIHSFRCCFRRELKKVLNSLKKGTSSDERYVPNLWYYDILSFIADSEMPRGAKSNLVEESLLEEESQVEGSDSENDKASLNVEESSLDSSASPSPALIQPSSSISKLSKYPQTLKYLQLRGKKDELASLGSETVRKYCSTEVNETPDRILNCLSDCDIAGMKYARDLTSLDPVQRIFVEKLVADATFYAKQGKLTEHSSFQLKMRSSCSNVSCPHQC